jgi:hypothetical protein
MRNLRLAIRTLLRTPGFTLIAILSLGLGIGANTAVFSLVDAIVLRPLPVPDPGTLVSVDSDSSATAASLISYPDPTEALRAE